MDFMNNISEKLFSSSTSSSNEDTKSDCLTCEEGLMESEKCARCRPCAHIFMSHCLLEWFSKNKHGQCPICELFIAKRQKEVPNRQKIETTASTISILEEKLKKYEETVREAENCIRNLKEEAENNLQRALRAEIQLEMSDENNRDAADQVQKLIGSLNNMEGIVNAVGGDGQEIRKSLQQVLERHGSAEKRANKAEKQVQKTFEELLEDNESTAKYVRESNQLFDNHLEELGKQVNRNCQESEDLSKRQSQEFEQQKKKQMKEVNLVGKKPEEREQIRKRHLEEVRKITERRVRETSKLDERQFRTFFQLTEKQVQQMKNLLTRQLAEAKGKKDIDNGLFEKLKYLADLKIRVSEDQAALEVREYGERVKNF